MTKRECSFPGCDHAYESKGYCRGHRSQVRRGVKLTPLRKYSPPKPTPKAKPKPKPVPFRDPVWGTEEFGRMMSEAPRWSGKKGSYT